jgi:acyl-coenzyme A synthetase/AMP-(fatty) acid ligase
MSKLGSVIEGVLKVDPAAEAIEFQGRWWTWGDLARIGAAVETALAGAGLGASARVGGMMRNRPEMSAALLQVVASDRCLVTLNPSLPDDRLAEDIRSLRPAAIVGFARDWERPAALAAAREIGCLGLEFTDDLEAAVRPVAGLEQVTSAATRTTADAGVAIEMLTSGTTGAPKRIPLKLKTLEQSVFDAGVYDKRTADDAPKLRGGVTVVNAPYAHISGVFGLLNAVVAGRKQSLLERFTVEGWVDAVRRHKPKVAGAPPSALRMILDANIPKEDLASLVAYRAGTAPLDPDLADEFYERYGIPILQNYSATEFAGAGAGWTLEDFRQHHKDKRGSVGRINPGIQARVVDPDSGEELPLGSQGLLEILAPHLGDGRNWLRTTDLAVLDADNFLWIKGRADNAIIRGGFKIMPDDVVRALEQHPAIREAAVTALSDPRLGQVPVSAYIVRSGQAAPSAEELTAFLRERLLPYQVPTRLLEVEDLPRTPSLKVSQPELRKLFETATV